MNVVVEALEERLKGFEQVAKLLENININDIVRKLEKVDALEKKVESMDEIIKKDATNVEKLRQKTTKSLNVGDVIRNLQ